MRRIIRTTFLALGLAPALAAQEPHFGFGFNLAFPTGEFRSRTMTYVDPQTGPYHQNEGYDTGAGAQFMISFPLQNNVAFRMNFGGQSTSGSLTETGYSRQDLQHNIFSLAGEMQFFLNGSANRHRGTYLFFGPSADFERWDYTYGDNGNPYGYWDNTTYDRKSRMGANFGFGHSFGHFAGRYTMEFAFHKTLSGNDVNKGEPPSADFVKLTFGWVF